MSCLNIKKAVDNIRSGTNIFTPITAIIINAIQVIEKLGSTNDLVEIRVHRIAQTELDDICMQHKNVAPKITYALGVLVIKCS